MRLAILIGHFPPDAVGGAELQAQAWARRLAARHDVVVVTRFSAPAHAARERRDGYEVVRLRPARLPGWRTVHDLLSIERAVRALPRRPDLLLCFQTFISGFAGIRIQRHTGIPAVVWVRGEGEVRLARSPLARWVGPRVWEAARGVLVQSEAVRTTLLAELERVAPRLRAGLPGKLEVVPNGLELPDPPFTRGGRVLTVGRLIRDKGMDTVIDAVAGVQGLLTLAGEGAERAALEARAKRHGLDARFEGVVDRGRLERL